MLRFDYSNLFRRFALFVRFVWLTQLSHILAVMAAIIKFHMHRTVCSEISHRTWAKWNVKLSKKAIGQKIMCFFFFFTFSQLNWTLNDLNWSFFVSVVDFGFVYFWLAMINQHGKLYVQALTGWCNLLNGKKICFNWTDEIAYFFFVAPIEQHKWNILPESCCSF